ncbi:TrbL/VirB6 plasmid conjugal transfer protein, partial [Providencia rustigianii DSM 4541]
MENATATSDFFQTAYQVIWDMLNKTVANKVSEYSQIAVDLAQYGISIYILWFAFSSLAMKNKTPVPDFIWNLTRFTIILMFIKNSGGWLDASTNAIYGLRDTLAGGDPWKWMDQLWVKTSQVAAHIMSKDTSTYVKVDGGIGSFLTYFGGLVALLSCAFVFFAAEITLLLLTTTAPIFIMCLMFGFLRQMFNNWLQLIFSSLLIVMFGALALRAGMAFLNIVLSVSVAQAAEANLMQLGATAAAAGLFMAFVIFLAKNFASQIAGAGVDGAVQGMAMMGVMGAGMMAFKGIKKAAGMADKAANAGKNNRDRGWNGATTSASGGSSAPNSAKSRRQASIDNV